MFTGQRVAPACAESRPTQPTTAHTFTSVSAACLSSLLISSTGICLMMTSAPSRFLRQSCTTLAMFAKGGEEKGGGGKRLKLGRRSRVARSSLTRRHRDQQRESSRSCSCPSAREAGRDLRTSGGIPGLSERLPLLLLLAARCAGAEDGRCGRGEKPDLKAAERMSRESVAETQHPQHPQLTRRKRKQ